MIYLYFFSCSVFFTIFIFDVLLVVRSGIINLLFFSYNCSWFLFKDIKKCSIGLKINKKNCFRKSTVCSLSFKFQVPTKCFFKTHNDIDFVDYLFYFKEVMIFYFYVRRHIHQYQFIFNKQ